MLGMKYQKNKKIRVITHQKLIDASLHLYKRVCLSVRPSVGLSVRKAFGHAFVNKT